MHKFDRLKYDEIIQRLAIFLKDKFVRDLL